MTAHRRIRIVASEPSARQSVAEALAAADLGPVEMELVATVEQGAELPALLVTCGEDAVILCKRAREHANLGAVPIFAVVSQSDVAASALGAGADEVAVVSLAPEILGHRVGRLLALEGTASLERSRQITRASYEADRRLKTIESLKEHFEASADGVVVLDEEGGILFVNKTAEIITGFAGDGLLGTELASLVPQHQREPLRNVIRGVLGGTNLQAFDLFLPTTSGRSICASVTTSTVLAKSGAVILSFRDVTEQRALETELRQTKDFLEKLIGSTVDAIIAADLRGRVLLFNPGAERIYGYRAEQVIGRIPVWKLYPSGVGRQVMRMLRSTSYGGVGKLEQTRREVMSATGELIPVNMTASIIYEEGREVATVGIFSDLREQIRMEQRLLQAQAKIETQERLAMVAELAGAAAHELNQPLTSIIAYAQLIDRQSEPDAPHKRGVDVILREAERMSEIVKKIGRITRYETKEYVGSDRIVDLDRSAAPGAGTMDTSPILWGEEFGAEEEFDSDEPTQQFDPERIEATLARIRAETSNEEPRSARREGEEHSTVRLRAMKLLEEKEGEASPGEGEVEQPEGDEEAEEESKGSDERRFV